MVYPPHTDMNVQTIGRTVAELLFEVGAIQVSHAQPFFLASGWASPVYVDARLLMGSARVRSSICDLAARYVSTLLPGDSFDAIAGAETAGIPFASMLADHLQTELRYVRKRPLGIGRNAQVEGGSVEGRTLLLVDDMTTDGTSKLRFAHGLRAAGGRVETVLTVFYHDIFPGSAERLSQAGLELHALATWRDVITLEHGLGDRERQAIKDFLDDPVQWSAQHGGRTHAPVDINS